MIYTVNGDLGQNVPFNDFGFMVNDLIIDGQYGHLYDSVETIDDAIAAIDDALDSSEWRRITYCCNNYANPNAPLIYEFLIPIAEDYTNTKPLNQVFSTDGSENVNAVFNDVTIENVQNSWTINGNATIANLTFAQSSTYFSVQGANLEIRWFWVVLPSECVIDGRFNFVEGQKYMVFSAGVSQNRNALSNPWTWHAGQYTAILAVPSFWYDLNGTSPDRMDNDPYGGEDGGGSSETGGGANDQDNWDDDSDSNPIPSLPSLSAVNTGFIELFAPTVSQLKTLATYMWSGGFDLNTFKKIFANPMDCILGLSIVPVNVAGSASSVTVGNIDTGVSMNKAMSQYVTVDCGTVKVTEKLHSYLDYSPYRKVSIFLPYIGTQELDIDILNGSTIGVVYHIDILTGGCVAYITVNGNVIAHYNGQCAVHIPVSAIDFSNTINAICTLVSSAAGSIASGGLTAPVTASEIAGLVSAGASTSSNVMNSKPTIQKGGSIGSSTGLLACQKPFLIIERPNLCRPSNQNHYTGYPSYITVSLGSISGFTQVQDIHLNNFTMTDSERNELLNALRTGVML